MNITKEVDEKLAKSFADSSCRHCRGRGIQVLHRIIKGMKMIVGKYFDRESLYCYCVLKNAKKYK